MGNCVKVQNRLHKELGKFTIMSQPIIKDCGLIFMLGVQKKIKRISKIFLLLPKF